MGLERWLQHWKNIGCSSRGPGFDSQYSRRGSQSSETAVPKIQCRLMAFAGVVQDVVHSYTCGQNTQAQ